MNSDSSSEEDVAVSNFDEEVVIKYYFQRGFSYGEIILFLKNHHDHQISYRTLLRRLKLYGLKRRNVESCASLQRTHNEVRNRITEMIDGPGAAGGYRTVWHALEIEGMRVPRSIVQSLLKELDPAASENRRGHRLQRRRYVNPGPNFAWHIDGYDKLKPWGFPIHGAIDGFSRKVLWLNVTRSNNAPDNIAYFYLSTVTSLGGCPAELITDLGTENGLAASLQAYFRENPDAHRYVSSPRNQRIEAWWSQFCKQRSSWWRNFFKDLESKHVIDTSSEINMEALWFSFSEVLQKDLDLVKEHWNTHRIRKSNYQTVAGRPDALYYLPEQIGSSDQKQHVSDSIINDVSNHVIMKDYSNDYSCYFNYVTNHLGIVKPTSWKESLNLYEEILSHM